MAYKIEFSVRAFRDIDTIVTYIHADTPSGATRWRKRLKQKLISLCTMPEACGYAPENEDARCEVRQLLFGNYRVLFTIIDNTVFLLTIRHCARRNIAGDELDKMKSKR